MDKTVALADKVMAWSRPVLGAFSLAIFAVAFYMAATNKDSTTLSLLVGAIISTVNLVMGYFFGSSASSQKKDDVIAAVAQSPTTGTPAPVAPSAPPGK